MTQPVRQTAERPQAYWETIRDRIDSSKAVGVINDVLHKRNGVDVLQAQMAWQVVNKLLPSVQAIHMEVAHKVSMTWDDIKSNALEHGIDPKLLISQENPVPAQVDSDGGHPPDVDE